MVPVASELIEEVTAHAQSDSLEDAREICTDGTYFPNNLRITDYKFALFFLTTVTSHFLLASLIHNTSPCNKQCVYQIHVSLS